MRDPLQAGERIRDTYDVVRILGASELSTVYLTRASNGHHYVVREIRPPVESDRHMERVIAHVNRQIQIVQKLQQGGLPHLVEHFVWEDLAYVVRDFVEDNTLVEVLEHMRGLPSDHHVRGWIGQLAEIFDYLHGQQPPFVFSGLRPEMITLSKMGKIHIRDYPTTCFLPGEIQWKYARKTAPGYIAPEQERGEPPTPASDIYNLGQLYFFMLTRKDPALYPYSRNLLAIARPDATEGLQTLLDNATRRAPDQRTQTIGDFRQMMMGGVGRTRSDHEVTFQLDPRNVKVEHVKKGELVRRKIRLTSKNGREVYGKVRSEQEWIRFKFDVFRGNSVDLDFSINTYEFNSGESYSGVIQVDTDAGVDEVPVEVCMEKSIGSRLVGRFKSLFGRGERGESVESDF